VTKTPSILHVDMDAFFASVEIVQQPGLRGKPVVVGGAGERGVVAAASYEARIYGIHSAMSSYRARQLCPHLIFLSGHYGLYEEVSRRIMDIFEQFTPLVEPISLDEAFLDVSGAGRSLGAPQKLAQEIRDRIYAAEGLRCAVGVAPNKFLAKLASNEAKPRVKGKEILPGLGVCVVETENINGFLFPLPIKAVWGIGPKTEERLHRLGIQTVGDLAQVPETTLITTLGNAAGRQLWRLARGRDERRVNPQQGVKSIGHEETFAQDLFARPALRRELTRMVDAVAGRLRKADKLGRTISIKVRAPDFTTLTRSHTLPDATDLGVEILSVAQTLLDNLDLSKGVRLLGVAVSGLQGAEAQQLRLEDAGAPSWREIDETVDEIRRRFGGDAIGPGSAVGPDGLKPKQRGDQQWGPNKDEN
jgi:DNA polymerase-4